MLLFRKIKKLYFSRNTIIFVLIVYFFLHLHLHFLFYLFFLICIFSIQISLHLTFLVQDGWTKISFDEILFTLRSVHEAKYEPIFVLYEVRAYLRYTNMNTNNSSKVIFVIIFYREITTKSWQRKDFFVKMKISL